MKSDLSVGEIILRRTIPVFINSFNQLTYLRNLVDKLQADGFRNIYILDNKSTYPPLLNYYGDLTGKSQAEVIFYGENRGPHFFHMKGVFKIFGSLPHIFSDPDLSYENLAPNFLTRLMEVSEKYKMFKVGPALELPSESELDASLYTEKDGKRLGVREWESQFWETQIEENLYYPGQIDTTFHLFNPKYFVVGSALIDGIRTGGEGFTFKHLPWYLERIVPQEEINYYKTAASEKNSWKSVT